ncbi:MAG: Rid family hydrolase [Candidatus Kapaibacterium sp.]
MKNIFLDKNDWVEKVGYCRAKRVGNNIYISGTVANDDEGNPVGLDNAGYQTRVILERFEAIMDYFGYGLEAIVRTRIFTTDINRWEEIGNVHGEFFKDIKPTTTMVEVSRLIRDEYLVEIEAEAIIEI